MASMDKHEILAKIHSDNESITIRPYRGGYLITVFDRQGQYNQIILSPAGAGSLGAWLHRTAAKDITGTNG
jgi:hypothetical protein